MANAPLPTSALPAIDKDGRFTLAWYRWFQSRIGGGSGGVGPEGPPGEQGPPGKDATSDATLSLLSLARGGSRVTSVTSSTADLSVANPYGDVRLTIVSSPKWDTTRTASFTGDATGGPTNVDGSANWSTALTFATVNANVGTFGDATHVGQFTVSGKGLITAASSVAITYPIPTFGSGAPSTLVSEGAIYFDTTPSPYAGYVQHSGAWHAFS